MEEISPKISADLKQTAKGIWYLGSLKINVNNIEELDYLLDATSSRVELKINNLNNKAETIIKDKNLEKEEIVLDPLGERLFNHLKKIRLEIARKEGYPPYVIFHDSVLRKMAKQKPVSLESMRELIGEKKFEKYGSIFVKEIFQFI